MTLEQATARGHTRVSPDLAAEIVSPNDLAYDVGEKVQEWLRAGASLVWVVNPETRTVEVHRARGTGTILREEDYLDGEDVLPGFACSLAGIF